VDYLLKYEESAKYAFNRAAEYRLMFYNVLWDNNDLEERAILQTEVIRAYNPNVIGFQEFHERRRTAIVPVLQEMGYAEAMNYKQGNFVSGSSGTTKSNLYCYVPIFYKTETTKCIESGFYRYEAQYSVAGSASKTFSWAVLEDKATSERYLVVNTHMCTQDDAIKGKQAVEAVKVIDNLLRKYDVPVFLGGDYNGRYTNANHKYFAEEGGFFDVVQSKLADEYTANIQAHHRPYPVFNKDLGLMGPGPDDDTGKGDATLSVDHIMVKNDRPVSIEVFGTVADNYTISGGDHFPIFIDFSIG
jgi:exonuclease III